MNYDAFERQLSAGKMLSVYFFYGPQAYLAQRGIQMVCRSMAGRAGQPAQVRRLDAGEVTLGEVLMQARSMSLFGGWQIIQVDRFERYVGKATAGESRSGFGAEGSPASGYEADGATPGAAVSASKGDLAALEAYLQAPSGGTTLLLVAGYLRKEDLNRKLFKLLAPFAVECRVSARDVSGWVSRLARERGLSLDAEGVRLLREIVGDDLSLVDGELEKLSLTLPRGSRVAASVLRDVLAETSRDDIYKFLNTLGERKLVSSLRALRSIASTSWEATWIIAALQAHFNQLAMARELKEAGLGKKEIANRIGLNPYFVENYLVQASRFTRDEMVEAMGAIVEAEEAMKTSLLRSRELLEGLVLRICGALGKPKENSIRSA